MSESDTEIFSPIHTPHKLRKHRLGYMWLDFFLSWLIFW